MKKAMRKLKKRVKNKIKLFKGNSSNLNQNNSSVKQETAPKKKTEKKEKLTEYQAKYKADKNYRLLVDYTNHYNNLEINDMTILYESFHGKTMSDSPLAIFKRLINDPKYKDYTHIWALNDIENCREEFRELENVKFVKVNTNLYLKALASAKYLINNTTFPPYFIRKEGQIYVNTWHGTPLKTLGKDMKGSIGQHKNIQRNFLQATHLINPNKYTADIIIDSHDLRGLYSGYVTDFGYPRADLTLNCNKELLKEKLNIDPNKKVLLYAPTWRGEVGKVQGEINKFISDYKKMSEELNEEYVILLRVHSLMYKYLKAEGLEKNVVPESIDTNELLGIVDLLVTDYSSIMFDFMCTKNPMLFYAYDRKEYEDSRGTYLSLDDMPGKICTTVDEVVDSVINIKSVINENKQKYKKCIEKYCYNDDGFATERAIDFIFNDDKSKAYQVLDNKKNIVMYCGGFLNNGITASAINLLNNIDYDKYNVAVIDKDSYDEESSFNFNKLNSKVKKLYRVGSMNPTVKESDIQSKIFKEGLKRNIEEETELYNLYNRESRRLFGDTKFDIAIDFSGYVKFWTLTLVCGNHDRKVIYQHNDMMAEYHKIIDGKYVHKMNMEVIFPLYNSFDAVISVAKHTMDLNATTLQYTVKKIKQKICCVHNSINYEKVLSDSKEAHYYKINNTNYYMLDSDINNDIISLKGVIAPNKDNINFVNVGRLSPEKDQEKLIRAFSKIVPTHNNIKLYILGDGVLREKLESLILELNMSENIIMLGQVKNPFAFINQCDCFVLSSNHEGQPMVLLENLILEKDIIATDIAGNRSILQDGYGTLVENSEEGLINGIETYIANGMDKKKFDYVKYNQEAMEMFYKNACGEF